MTRRWKWSENGRAAQPMVRPLAVVACIVCLACGPDGDGESRPADLITPKVLLIGLDGVRHDVLSEVETPAIDALVAGGALTIETTTTTPSVSGPAWSSMLTGVWPDKHGVVSNDFVAPRYGEYPDVLTLAEEARPELVTVAIADWPPLMELPDRRPLFGFGLDVRIALNGYELGWLEADTRSVEIVVEELRSADPDLLFVYLGNPDETSHETGAIGEEYRRAIALADAQVGRLVEAVRSRPTYASEDWLVLVSTDHGRRADGGHGGDSPEEMTTFIIVSGPSAADTIAPPTFIVDVAATALAHLGIEARDEWALDGKRIGLR